MAVAFSDLVAQLQALVQVDASGRPTTEQYQHAVRSAVAAFSHDDGLIKSATLSIVAGTSQYALPADFIRLIRMEALLSGKTFVQPGGKLLPLNVNTLNERYVINGQELVIVPTPEYSVDRVYFYKAAHVPDGSDEYPYMGDAERALVMLLACAEIVRLVSVTDPGATLRYTFGDVTVDRTGQASSHAQVMGLYENEYKRRLASYRGLRATVFLPDLEQQINILENLT